MNQKFALFGLLSPRTAHRDCVHFFAASRRRGMPPKAAKEAKTKAAPAKSPEKAKPDAAKSSGDKKEKSDRNGKKEKTKKAVSAAGKQSEMDLSSKPEPANVEPAVDPNASFLDKLAAAESKPPLGKPENRRSASKAALGPQPFPARSSSNSALKPKGPKAPA